MNLIHPPDTLKRELQPQLLKIWKAEAIDAIGLPGTILSADKMGIVVGCGQGAVRILEVQREGGKRLTAEQFLAGCHLKPGAKFPG